MPDQTSHRALTICSCGLARVKTDASRADGDIGRVHDLYFDDRRWTVRYLVVDTRHWLPGRRVLLSPAAVRLPDWAHHEIVASLSREQIRRCPGIDSDPPVGRLLGAPSYDPSRPVTGSDEMRLRAYYGRPTRHPRDRMIC